MRLGTGAVYGLNYKYRFKDAFNKRSDTVDELRSSRIANELVYPPLIKWMWKLDYEYHLWLGQRLDSSRLYGKHRVNVSLGLIKRKVVRDRILHAGRTYLVVTEPYMIETWRFNAALSIVADPKLNMQDAAGNTSAAALYKRVNLVLAAYYKVKGGNTSIFLQTGFYGADPYNVYYAQSAFFIRSGLALAVGRTNMSRDLHKRFLE